MINQDIIILQHVPFLKHLTYTEFLEFLKIVKPLKVTKGQILPCDAHLLYIIKEGIFKIKRFNESVYMTKKSFFGELPFCEKGKGVCEAVTDSIVYEIKDVDLYNFFCNNFKALRGYLRIANFYNFPLTDAGKNLYEKRAQIITIFSTERHCGKTTLAVAMATVCSLIKKTILLDASYEGISVFDMCGKRLIPPLSQKNPDEVTGQKFIAQRIEKVSQTLDIINVAYASKVRINPDIINPLLFYLSSEYSYIIIDCSNIDEHLRNTILNNSDIILQIVTNKSIQKIYTIDDSLLTQGQQVINVVNTHFGNTSKIESAYYSFTTIPVLSDETVFQATLRKDLKDDLLFEQVLSPKKSMVFSGGMYETLYYAGFIEMLLDLNNKPDIIYTAGIPYALLLTLLYSQSSKDYKKILLHYFSDNRLHSMLDIIFPQRYLFKKDPLLAFASSVASSRRIESLPIIPYTMLVSHENERLFSTGNGSNLLAASLSFIPLFEGIDFNGIEYHAPFPLNKIIPETLLRTHIQKIIYVSIDTLANPISHKSRILGIYRKFLDFLPYCHFNDSKAACDICVTLPLPQVMSLVQLMQASFDNRDNFKEIIVKVLGG